MKLTGELKDKVEVADTMAAKKNIIAEAGMELTDDELEGVVGGIELDDEIMMRKERREKLKKECKILEKCIRLKEYNTLEEFKMLNDRMLQIIEELMTL